MSSTPTKSDDQLRRARRELEQRLRSGAAGRAEDLLAEYPDLAEDPESALELIYTEYVLREELGQRPDVAEFIKRFPDRRPDLAELFQVHDALVRVGEVADGTAPESTTAFVTGARRVAGYEILRELGRGGMGVVYQARQAGLNRIVALKLILAGAHAGSKDRERFRREVEAAARLDHPGIVRVFEVGEAEGRPYCAMEFVEGGSLVDGLTGFPWPWRSAARFVARLARAAHHAHERGIVHRDLKPANVLIAPRPPDESGPPAAGPDTLHPSADSSRFNVFPKIADFGLAKSLGDGPSGPTRTGDLLGTPAYMAPEQADGRISAVGPTTDVWALGVILYELLTGRPPFQGDSGHETMQLVQTQDPVSPRRLRAGLPRDLETICLKCLAKPQSGRYATAAELADDLERRLEWRTIVARPVGPVVRFARWCGRSPRLAALSIAVVLLLATAAGLGAAAIVNLTDARTKAAKLAKQEQAARRIEAAERLRERRRFSQLLVADGLRRLDAGDGTAAAVLFAAALNADPDPDAERAHRIRLAATLRAAPELLRSYWRPVDRRAAVRFSADGTHMTTYLGDNLITWDTAIGKRLGEFPVPQLDESSVGIPGADGRTYFSVYDKKVHATDAVTGRPVPLPLGGDRRAPERDYTPDGSRRLRYMALQRKVYIYTHDGTLLAGPLPPDGGCSTAEMSRDGRMVLTADEDGRARLWQADGGRRIAGAMNHGGVIRSIRFSPDGTRVASAGNDGTVQVWDAKTGLAVGHRVTLGVPIAAIEFTPDGKRLVAWDHDGTSGRIIDAARGVPAGAPLLHDGRMMGLDFTPDGRRILTAAQDHSARVWDLTTGRPITPPIVHSLLGMAGHFIGDGDRFVTTSYDGLVRIWKSAEAPAVRITADVPVKWCGWRPDGRAILSFGGTAARLDDAETGKVLFTIPHPAAVRMASLSADGSRIATVAADGVGRLYDARNGSLIGELRPREPIELVDFAADGRVVTAGTNTIQLWDGASGRPLAAPLAQAGPFRNLALPASGAGLLTDGKAMQVWNPDSRELLASFDVRDAAISALPARSGTTFVVVAKRGVVRAHRFLDGRPAGPEIDLHGTRGPTCVGPDGRLIAFDRSPRGMEDGVLQFWEAATGRRVGESIKHRQVMTWIALDRAGRLVVAVSGREARVWDIASGLPVTPPLLHEDRILAAHFRPDGRALVTAGATSGLRVWDLSPAEGTPERLVALTSLRADRRLDDRGVLVILSKDDEQALWRRFDPDARTSREQSTGH